MSVYIFLIKTVPVIFLENLRWGTRADNERDKKSAGRDNSGERNGRSVLTVEQVREIRRRYLLGECLRFVVREGITSLRNARFVVKGKTWKNV